MYNREVVIIMIKLIDIYRFTGKLYTYIIML